LKAEITLVLGGARSGKSEVAERVARDLGVPVTFVATAGDPGDDAEWAERIRRHRDRRPPEWTTLECGPGQDLAEEIAALRGPVLVDSLGTWVAGIDGFDVDRPARLLTGALAERRSDGRASIVVSEEVGLGVHPSTAVGGTFRDALGVLNRTVSEIADTVLLIVAGRVVPLGEIGAAR
jgi:adenosylcobinamide kinase/adenosylcobinamide-phosphate guanylyltransferase